MKTLKAGFEALGRILNASTKISGVSDDSRQVKSGDVFVAIKGLTSDGHDYIREVIEKGVKIIVGEENVKVPASVNYIRVPNSREALGILASAFYGDPSEKLIVIGVTGTKGKTTTCHIISHILAQFGQKTKLVSSITTSGFHVTTPDVISLNRDLKRAVDEGCKYAVIEVSSHGIDQGRIAGIKFDIGVLTNIAPEHLDYHKSLTQYKKTKMAFINSANIKIISKTKTDLKNLPGEFNNINAQTAVDVAVALGYDKNKAIKALGSFILPSGRMEEIENNLGIKIYIDFAHTPDSLKAVLTHLKRQVKEKSVGNLSKLICVFGCAGERDPRKRYAMGEISGRLADFSVLTAEDPRSENLNAILRQIERGANNGGGKNINILERGEAIAFALSTAKKGDVVVICGKGHERSMAYQGFEHPWSDQDIVKQFLKRDLDISAIVLAAGRGSRMKSSLPKVLREICGRPMVAYTLENLRKAGIADITLVVGYKKNLVVKAVGGAVKIAFQKNSKGGTADAAKTGYSQISGRSKVLVVVNGDDSAFYTSETIRKVVALHLKRGRKLTFISLIKEDPRGLGRVIRGTNGLITALVEEKDTTWQERKIKEVNDGFYVFDRKWFKDNIDKIKKGPQGEYYLTDAVKLAIDQGDKMATYTLPNDDEWQGINTPEQLEEANKKMARRLTA